jgi:galactitol-specific phosphotransferase system IIC component
LDHFEKIHETFEIWGSVGFIDFISGHVQGIHGVESDATLIATAGFMGDEAKHLDLFNEVVDGLMDVSEPVYFFPCQMAGGRHQVFMLGHEGELIGLAAALIWGIKAGWVVTSSTCFPL